MQCSFVLECFLLILLEYIGLYPAEKLHWWKRFLSVQYDFSSFSLLLQPKMPPESLLLGARARGGGKSGLLWENQCKSPPFYQWKCFFLLTWLFYCIRVFYCFDFHNIKLLCKHIINELHNCSQSCNWAAEDDGTTQSLYCILFLITSEYVHCPVSVPSVYLVTLFFIPKYVEFMVFLSVASTIA